MVVVRIRAIGLVLIGSGFGWWMKNSHVYLSVLWTENNTERA